MPARHMWRSFACLQVVCLMLQQTGRFIAATLAHSGNPFIHFLPPANREGRPHFLFSLCSSGC